MRAWLRRANAARDRIVSLHTNPLNNQFNDSEFSQVEDSMMAWVLENRPPYDARGVARRVLVNRRETLKPRLLAGQRSLFGEHFELTLNEPGEGVCMAVAVQYQYISAHQAEIKQFMAQSAAFNEKNAFYTERIPQFKPNETALELEERLFAYQRAKGVPPPEEEHEDEDEDE